jgi:hypothetical protein
MCARSQKTSLKESTVTMKAVLECQPSLIIKIALLFMVLFETLVTGFILGAIYGGRC